MKMERRVEVGGKSDPWREAVIGKGVVAGDAIGNRMKGKKTTRRGLANGIEREGD